MSYVVLTGNVLRRRYSGEPDLQTMFELAGRAASWVMKIIDLEAQQFHRRVEAYVNEIQRILRFYTEADPKLDGMGTTS